MQQQQAGLMQQEAYVAGARAAMAAQHDAYAQQLGGAPAILGTHRSDLELQMELAESKPKKSSIFARMFGM